ncbi:cysteine hydrolase family protein [Butyrivibrio sp. DSM 10294]|uniref:cysteine hydrolase family protein n=1 Tax=Butyrivibrio sp. DSM 10294 TaxID=2972457 RepID=UPI00234E3F5B|nr:isochorismatase family cysteine hydrolase [Butyrivibrio sp. DSM 10294]
MKILKNFGDKQVQNTLEISVLDDFDGKKALLVIDVQERYMHKYDPNLITRINNRISEADNDGILTIYVKNAGDPGSEDQYALADDLLIVSEYIFEKKFPSAFTSEEFKSFLEEQKITDLELIGVDGSSCVAKTAFAAKENGYEVSVNLNCVSSVNDKIFKDTQVKMKEVGIRLIKDALGAEYEA